MQIVPLLLVTSTLVAPAPAPSSPNLAVQPAQIQTGSGAQGYAPTVPNSQPHTLGLGANITASNRGVGTSFQYWFGQHLGMKVAAAWYHGGTYRASNYAGTQTSSSIKVPSMVQASPSLTYMFGHANITQEVNLRPYLGAGMTYTSASRSLTSPTSSRYGATGGQGFGGAEMTFRDYDSLALNFELFYTQRAAIVNNAYYRSGLNYQVGITFYLK